MGMSMLLGSCSTFSIFLSTATSFLFLFHFPVSSQDAISWHLHVHVQSIKKKKKSHFNVVKIIIIIIIIFEKTYSFRCFCFFLCLFENDKSLYTFVFAQSHLYSIHECTACFPLPFSIFMNDGTIAMKCNNMTMITMINDMYATMPIPKRAQLLVLL